MRHSRTPARHSVSSYDEELRRLELEGRRPVVVGRAKPILASVIGYGPSSEESMLRTVACPVLPLVCLIRFIFILYMD